MNSPKKQVDIKIDFAQYDIIQKGVENQTFNPFSMYLEDKRR